MSKGECRFILGTLYCWLLDFIFKQTWCDVFFFFIISYNNLSMQAKDYWYQYWSQVCPVLWYMTPYFQCAVRSTIANLNFLMNHTSTISFTHPPVKPILWLYHTLRCFIYIYITELKPVWGQASYFLDLDLPPLFAEHCYRGFVRRTINEFAPLPVYKTNMFVLLPWSWFVKDLCAELIAHNKETKQTDVVWSTNWILSAKCVPLPHSSSCVFSRRISK